MEQELKAYASPMGVWHYVVDGGKVYEVAPNLANQIRDYANPKDVENFIGAFTGGEVDAEKVIALFKTHKANNKVFHQL